MPEAGAMGDRLWWTEPDGVLASEAGGFRLVVRAVDGWVRYLVLRQPGGAVVRPPGLLASGHEHDARAAMLAAERTAARMAGEGDRATRPRRYAS